MSIKTYLLVDETFTKLTRMSLEIISKQLSTAIQSVDEQLKTFDLHGFKQSSSTVTGSKTDNRFSVKSASPLRVLEWHWENTLIVCCWIKASF